MDSTVTGSVADIRAPNIRHSTNGILYKRKINPPRYLKRKKNLYDENWIKIVHETIYKKVYR